MAGKGERLLESVEAALDGEFGWGPGALEVVVDFLEIGPVAEPLAVFCPLHPLRSRAKGVTHEEWGIAAMRRDR